MVDLNRALGQMVDRSLADAIQKALAKTEASLRENLGLAPQRSDAYETADPWSEGVRVGLTKIIVEVFSDEGIARAIASYGVNESRSPSTRMGLAIAAALNAEEFVTIDEE